jgi:ABC-type transport system involved in multi-copper enzyme maturation permease subunit
MRRVLKTVITIEKSNKKNIIACLVAVVFVFGLMSFIITEEKGDLVKERTGDYQSVSSALYKFQIEDASENGNGSDLYKNLVRQQRIISTQRAAVRMTRPELYLETSLELADLREAAFKMEGFRDIALYLPTETKNQLNRVYYQQLAEEEKFLFQEPLSFFQFLGYLFSLIGSVWFIFISIYSCGILIEEFQHTSLIKGYPVSFDKYVLAKCSSSMLMTGIFILLLFICSLPLIYFKGLGDPFYPVAVFTGNIEVFSIIKYIGVSILYMIVIALFSILLSIILNMLLKNMYLTMFVQLFFYISPYLFPSMMALVPLSPLNYLNFNRILSGETLDLAKPAALQLSHGLFIISVCIVIMLIIVRAFFTAGKLKKI